MVIKGGERALHMITHEQHHRTSSCTSHMLGVNLLDECSVGACNAALAPACRQTARSDHCNFGWGLHQPANTPGRGCASCLSQGAVAWCCCRRGACWCPTCCWQRCWRRHCRRRLPVGVSLGTGMGNAGKIERQKIPDKQKWLRYHMAASTCTDFWAKLGLSRRTSGFRRSSIHGCTSRLWVFRLQQWLWNCWQDHAQWLSLTLCD